MLLPVILVTSFLIFWAMSLTGGDPARQIAGDRATEAEVEAIREEMGLNDPFLVRYGNYMKGMLTGDMGKSYVTNKDVFRTFMEKLPNTLMLGGAAVLIAIIVSLPLEGKPPVRVGYIAPKNSRLSVHAENFVRELERAIADSIRYTESLRPTV